MKDQRRKNWVDGGYPQHAPRHCGQSSVCAFTRQEPGRSSHSARCLVFNIQCLELLGCCGDALVSHHDNQETESRPETLEVRDAKLKHHRRSFSLRTWELLLPSLTFVSGFLSSVNAVMAREKDSLTASFFIFILGHHFTGCPGRFYEICLISPAASVFGRNCI